MRFLKQHYEKIILSVVLVCLAVAAAWLPMALKQAHDKLQVSAETPPPPKSYKPADLSTTISNLNAIKAPPPLVLNGEHNLFNPVVWKKKFDGTLIKIATGKEEGPDALTITKITPLHFILTFSRPASSDGYFFGVTREISGDKRERIKRDIYVSPTHTKEKYFIFRGVKGPPEDPVFTLELTDYAKELVTVTTNTPFDRVEGYSADLRYDLEKMSWNDQRVGSILRFAGDAYKIVYIDKNEVRVMANSNNKQTTIKWNSAP